MAWVGMWVGLTLVSSLHSCPYMDHISLVYVIVMLMLQNYVLKIYLVLIHVHVSDSTG